MDPITQGAIGAVAAGCFAKKDAASLRLALLAGWAGGMLADIDVFIRSSSDPLLQIEYHRHFTHSLIFIPVGGAICAALLWLVFRRRRPFLPILLFSTAGYATAGLLDACTSYGTQLGWPFSTERVAWNIISVIDPVFTLMILVMLFLGWKTRKTRWPGIAAVFALSYLAFGWLQFQRVTTIQRRTMASRGHLSNSTKATVKPTIGNVVLWRSLYEYEGKFYIDGIRRGIFGEGRVINGRSITAETVAGLKKRMPNDSVLAKDLERFDHFSAGYLGRHPAQPDVIGDVRYAMVPTSAVPLWGIRYDPDEPNQHVSFESFREIEKEERARFLRMLFKE